MTVYIICLCCLFVPVILFVHMIRFLDIVKKCVVFAINIFLYTVGLLLPIFSSTVIRTDGNEKNKNDSFCLFCQGLSRKKNYPEKKFH